MKNTLKINAGKTRMVAHRGVSGLEKENTMSAFIAAGNRSYWGVETDIHRTADGQFVVIHDDNTLRVSGTELIVEETDFHTLRNLCLLDTENRAGRTDLRIPTLTEYIRVCRDYGKFCVLELKNAFQKDDIGKVIEEIRSENYLDHVIFISFNFENLVFVRAFSPEQPVQFLTKQIDDQLVERLVAHHFDLDLYYRALTETWLRKLHENGVFVNCWTVNEPADGQQLADWGVDFITSNILESSAS